MFFTLITSVNSRIIWKRICDYGVNLTDMGTEIYIYGDCEEETFEKVKAICKEYGEVIE